MRKRLHPPAPLDIASFRPFLPIPPFPSLSPSPQNFCIESLAGVSKLLASLGHTGTRRVVLGHVLNTLRHIITKKSHKVLSKSTLLCWGACIDILGCTRPADCRLETPGREICMGRHWLTHLTGRALYLLLMHSCRFYFLMCS